MKLLAAVFCIVVFSNAPAAAKKDDLHRAVLDQDITLVKRLLSKGADINEVGSRSFRYGSALHLAIREGYVDIAKLLLDRGAEVDVLDPNDFTPLHNAAWNGNLDLVKLLLDAGADINASTYDGDTPLSLAQNNDQAQVAEFIQTRLQASSVVDAKVESVTASDSGAIDI
ncbi:MAG: ankyrin repeat domain-containing protein, partial [Gammaproteobacteria bacterium]|nr:ankyrin repeat domain-containing protein [Gammaproteobacteria bacterium]